MRIAAFARLLALPLIVHAAVASPAVDKASINAEKDGGTSRAGPPSGGKTAGDATGEDVSGEYTTFNDKRVPPMIELKGATLDEDIKDGYWLVEYFSPYCGHCKMFAPTWKTLYEFYHTSEPLPQTPGSGESHNDLNSFTRFYNFKFAKVDCSANGDACSSHHIRSFPTIVLYKNGEVVEQKVGGQNMKEMVKWVETILESIRPGSRTKDGPSKIPAAGDTSVEVAAPAPGRGQTKSSSSSALKGSANKAVTRATPNPQGKSVELDADTFQQFVTATGDAWFVKFYAPWCHHCQQLAPNWQGMSRKMQGQLNIGEVNCEVEKKLCKDIKVRGYPTILYFRGGERVEYEGLRGLGDLIGFANKAVAIEDGVLEVTASSFEELEKKEEVIFVYVYDDATTREDFAALDRLVLSLLGHARIVKTKDAALNERFKISTWPRLLVSRDGKASYYPPISPREMRDVRKVLGWMQSVWLPIVPELTSANAKEIMHGKLVVLGILDRDHPEFAVYKKEIKNAALEWIDKQTQAFQLERQELRDAKQLRIEEAEDRNDQRALRAAKSIRINMDDIERKEVGFAWVDGVFWERWIKTTFGLQVIDGAKVVINDEANQRYWDITMTGNPIVPSRTSIIETLPRVIANPPKIVAKSTTTALGHIWWVAKGQIIEHPIVSVVFGLLFILSAVWWSRNYLRAAKGGLIRLSEKGGMDGLLGGNTGDKVD